MTNFIPIFPLGIVVYPGERLHLHIFEERYKQLINECRETGRYFGIPAVIKNKVCELGMLMQLKEVVQVYENGEMDIRTEGIRVFRVLEFIRNVPDKLYSGAIVTYLENTLDRGRPDLMSRVVKGMREMHRLLDISKEFSKPDEELLSYDVGHHAGLSLEEEYEFLGLLEEVQRQEYLKRHLQKVLPMLMEMGHLKEKVKLNGHFRNLTSFDLDL